MKDQKQECCPTFDPVKWDNHSFSWDHKRFIKESVPTLFHIPFPPMIGRKMRKMFDLAEKSSSNIPDTSEALVLFHDPSAFKSEIFYSVSKEVKGAHNTSLSGEYISKVFDGPYNSIPKFITEMEKYLEVQGKKAKDYYVHYAYCPKCAREQGHNYSILFAEV